MVRDADRALEVLAAGRLIGEYRGHQIVRTHALYVGGNFCAGTRPQHGERAAGIPAPARGEHRRSQQRLREHVLHRLRLQKLEDDIERKRVEIGERDHDTVVSG